MGFCLRFRFRRVSGCEGLPVSGLGFKGLGFRVWGLGVGSFWELFAPSEELILNDKTETILRRAQVRLVLVQPAVHPLGIWGLA